jgi:hypothetical protein
MFPPPTSLKRRVDFLSVSYHDTELATRLGLPDPHPACEPTDRTCKTSSPDWRSSMSATGTTFGINLDRFDGQPVLSDPFLDDAHTLASTGNGGAREKAFIMPISTEVLDRASASPSVYEGSPRVRQRLFLNQGFSSTRPDSTMAPSVFNRFDTNASELEQIEAMVDAVHGKFTSEQIDEYTRNHQVSQSGYFIAPGGPIDWTLINNDQNGSGNEYDYPMSTYQILEQGTLDFNRIMLDYTKGRAGRQYPATTSEDEGSVFLDAWLAELEAESINVTKLVENASEGVKQQTTHQTQQTEALVHSYLDEQQPLHEPVQEPPHMNPNYLHHIPNTLEAVNEVHAGLQTRYNEVIASHRDLALQVQTKDAQIREQEKTIKELKEVINSLLAEKFGVV